MNEACIEEFARLSDFERSQKLVRNEDAFWIDPEKIGNLVAVLAQKSCCKGCGSQLPRRYWTYRGIEAQDATAMRMLVQYICQSCDDFILCGVCGVGDACMFPGHEMAMIDLKWLVESDMTQTPQKRSRSLLVTMAKLYQLQDGFCPTCFDARPGRYPKRLDLNRKAPRKGCRIPRSAYAYDFFLSSQRGCSLCAIIWRGVAFSLPRTTVHESTVFLLTISDRSLKLDLKAALDFEAWSFRRDLNSQSWDFEWPKLEVARNFDKHFESEKSFDAIKTWLSSCENYHRHPMCARPAEAVLPHRIIELVTACDDGTLSLRLRETCGESAKYIALSHRWGKVNPKTTTENLLQMCTGFTFDGLPKTYQDAITCGQRLGIRYLWIDSLCIIQDDREDWDRESERMGNIYRNAFFVIDAGSSNGEERGFLEERPEEFNGYPVRNLDNTGVSGIIVQKDMPHKESWYTKDRVRMGVKAVFNEGSSTSSRAWCMQEVSLSRRTLSFHRSEMVWECYSQMACECGFLPKESTPTHSGKDCNERPTSRSSSGANKEKIRSNFIWASHWSHIGLLDYKFTSSCVCEYTQKPFAFLGKLNTLFEEWRLMTIPLYTSRNLSVATDRLPALSAMAKVVDNENRSAAHVFPRYLAGIWRDDIQMGLLWSVPQIAFLPSTYLGPSFSWASVNRPVTYAITGPVTAGPVPGNFIRCFGDVAIELIDAHIELLGSNPFGQVKSANILIHGLAIVVQLRAHDHYYKILYKCESVKFRPDTILQHVEMQYGRKRYQTVNRSQGPTNGDWDAQLKCVLVADAHFQETAESGRIHNVAMLVLGQIVTEKGELAYQRLGLAIITMTPDHSQKWLNGLEPEEFFII